MRQWSHIDESCMLELDKGYVLDDDDDEDDCDRGEPMSRAK